MAKATIFQRLSAVVSGGTGNVNNYNIHNHKADSDILLRTKDKEEFDVAALQAKQQHLLAKQWKRAQYDITNRSLASLNEVKLMYREADLMDLFPEIGTALDIVTEECTYINDSGTVLNITSGSERVKSILQDLFTNRLSVNTMLPMICRSMCKYGNSFLLLNIDAHNGVTGWKELPVYEMERYEAGMENPYASAYANINSINPYTKESTKFVWVGNTDFIPYQDWQIAHFRLLYNSLFLPFGVSFLHKARRHFRLLSMMEDSMLLYRLERSIERRVYKVDVGTIDDKDVPAYIEEIANEFKRTPMVDPMTGQIDLRKNIMANMDDFFFPVRDPSQPSPIETLPAAQNLAAIDDIKFIQNKVFTALRVPKSFLNFEEAQGDGKNLSLLDVRFSKTVNRIQQALLMELNKVAIVHLLLLGFTDDLTNFNITMNNPSSQAEMLEIENTAKRITTAKDAVSDNGNGLPVMSLTRAWRTILKWSDKEIADNLEELRLERALAAELEKTSQIIKKTGIFDAVDNVYGEPGAEYSDDVPAEGEGGDMGGGGGASAGGMIGGGDLDFGDESETGDETDMEMGQEGEMDIDDAATEDISATQEGDTASTENLGESYMRKLLSETLVKQKRLSKKLTEKNSKYAEMLKARLNKDKKKEEAIERTPLYNKNFLINEELDNISKALTDIIDEK